MGISPSTLINWMEYGTKECSNRSMNYPTHCREVKSLKPSAHPWWSLPFNDLKRLDPVFFYIPRLFPLCQWVNNISTIFLLQNKKKTQFNKLPLETTPCANVQMTEQSTICKNQGKLVCSACKLVSYCSKVCRSIILNLHFVLKAIQECQKVHWKLHKRCKKLFNSRVLAYERYSY